jgi:hypothetical protein
VKGRGLLVAALLGLWLAVAVHPGRHAAEHPPPVHAVSAPAISHRWAAARFRAITRLQSTETGSARSAPAHGQASGPAPGQASRPEQVTATSQPPTTTGQWLVTVACVLAILAALGAAGLTAVGIRTAK